MKNQRPLLYSAATMLLSLQFCSPTHAMQGAGDNDPAGKKTPAKAAVLSADQAAVAHYDSIILANYDFDPGKWTEARRKAKLVVDATFAAASPNYRAHVNRAQTDKAKERKASKLVDAPLPVFANAVIVPTPTAAAGLKLALTNVNASASAAAVPAKPVAAPPPARTTALPTMAAIGLKPAAAAAPAKPVALTAPLPVPNAAAPKTATVSFRAVNVALDKVGATSNTITNGASGALTITTDNNAFASYQMTTPRFAVQEGQTVRITYDILVQQGGKISLGLLNTTKKGWYGVELVLEAGTHKGTYDRVVPAEQTETSLVFRNYHLGKAGQSTFTINKYGVEIQPAPVGAAAKK